jgi:hypothetical protein
LYLVEAIEWNTDWADYHGKICFLATKSATIRKIGVICVPVGWQLRNGTWIERMLTGY